MAKTWSRYSSPRALLWCRTSGVDGGEQAPVMEGEREVVADPGDVVGGGGLLEDDVGAGAVGHSRSSNSTMATRAPAGGRSAAGSWTWVPGSGGGELGVGGGPAKSARRRRPERGRHVWCERKRLGKAHEAMHRGWMAP